MYLYHYYDRRTGPFRNLSELPLDEANGVLKRVRADFPGSQCARRDDDYNNRRRRCEALVRAAFIEKGGKPVRTSPHYMVVEHSPWLSSWYEQLEAVRIPVEVFDPAVISFTYGDSMPAFNRNINHGKEYQCRLYTLPEILRIIEKYGLPQDWNNLGAHGPERYIEVQVWDDDVVMDYARQIQP